LSRDKRAPICLGSNERCFDSMACLRVPAALA